MEFIFIITSLMILLVPGFDDSVPPSDGKIFIIETNPDIVQSLKTQSDESFDFWGFDVELKPNSTGFLEVNIPKNLPTPASFIGFWAYDENPIILTNGKEINYEKIEDPCYSQYKIPINGEKNLEIVYTVITAGDWKLYNPIEFDKNNPCYDKVFYEKLDSPLKQFKDGINPKVIHCNNELILIQKHDDSPACVKPETIEKLIQRGWADVDDCYYVDSNDPDKIKHICKITDEKSLPLCTSDRTACFNHANLCDPAGWDCGNPIDIFNKTIPLPSSVSLLESQFQEIKHNIEQTNYDICNIKLENNKIIIDLNWIFKDSSAEKEIISKIPSYVNYQLVYYDGYTDFFIGENTAHICETLKIDTGNEN